MNGLDEKTEFDDWQSFMVAKKAYEVASKTLLTTKGSDVMKGNNDIAKKFCYIRKVFNCKAGAERKQQSKGVRKSSTYRRGCPVSVRVTNIQKYARTKLI